MDFNELKKKSEKELLDIAKEIGVLEENSNSKRRESVLNRVIRKYAETEGSISMEGILYITGDGYGFMRTIGVSTSSSDVYVSQSQIRRFGLRSGDDVYGEVRPPKDGERYFGLVKVEKVNGADPDLLKNRQHFEKLTPVYPDEQMVLESAQNELSIRLMDMVAPVGKGQRGLIVSPPKAGKTSLLKKIAFGISKNSPDVKILVALIGERPEEVTDLVRSIKGEVYSSTFDEPVEDHCRVAELVLERSKRLVENGHDVVILLDSITRMTRAYNLAVPNSGKTLSGGVDPVALYPPKRFFGAARNAEDGGSLTILAACLVDTGSRMDDVIYEEFKGTGNMEVHLDRNLAEQRVFPAIDIPRSGTRREELLLDAQTLKQVWLLRRMFSMISDDAKNSTEAVQQVLKLLANTKNNKEFLATLSKESK